MEEVNRKFEEFIKSEKYKDILIMMGNLGKYSLTNQVYILLQNLNTSFVNGMRGWNYLGRSIKKYGFSQVGVSGKNRFYHERDAGDGNRDALQKKIRIVK